MFVTVFSEIDVCIFFDDNHFIGYGQTNCGELRRKTKVFEEDLWP